MDSLLPQKLKQTGIWYLQTAKYHQSVSTSRHKRQSQNQPGQGSCELEHKVSPK
uniref:Uncharacterized protein n=1 Tax=Rhizophora mucronata TaxID=61149 RepID=A0A2P2P1H2_RHIMU